MQPSLHTGLCSTARGSDSRLIHTQHWPGASLVHSSSTGRAARLKVAAGPAGSRSGHSSSQLDTARRQLAGVVLSLVLVVPAALQPAAGSAAPVYRAQQAQGRPESGEQTAQAAKPSTGQRALQVLQLDKEAQEATAAGDYSKALDAYTTIGRSYSDLALSQKAHVKRALMLYQLGQHAAALSELKGVEARLRGNPEVHAALAAMLYDQQPPAMNRAELSWEVCMEFDTRYADPQWAQRERHWPPAALDALQRFLHLS